MRLVVGVTPEPQSLDALALGCTLAESLRAELVVTNIVPRGYDFPGPAHVDAEWRAFLIDQADATLDRARAELQGRPGVSYRMSFHNSSGVGLNRFAEEIDARLIVVGSAAGGSTDRIEIGSTADQLLHGSSTAVAIAPFGYASWAPVATGRVVLAYQATPEASHALELLVGMITSLDGLAQQRLALVSVVQQQTRIYGSRLGAHAEDGVMAALVEQAESALEAAATAVPAALRPVTTQVLTGRDVANALSHFEWGDDDLLVVGSTGRGPWRRVLLGDMSHRIVKATSVPVCVIPRSAGT